jgi:hypothetical protein
VEPHQEHEGGGGGGEAEPAGEGVVAHQHHEGHAAGQQRHHVHAAVKHEAGGVGSKNEEI